MLRSNERQGNIQNFRQLFDGPQSKCVRFCKKFECIRVRSGPDTEDWRSVNGMLDQLRRIFYWDYNYRHAICKTRRKRARSTSEEFVVEKRRLGVDGMELGKRIDEEANKYVARRILRGEDDQTATNDMTLYTKKLIAAKNRWGWKTLVAQFPIAIPALSVGTCIDSIEMDQECRLIVVELKYGYQDYLHEANSNMDSPLQDISNSPQNQHFLQVGVASLILEAIYSVQVHRAYVVYVDDHEVRPHPLPMWFHERRQAIWETFVKGMSKRLVGNKKRNRDAKYGRKAN